MPNFVKQPKLQKNVKPNQQINRFRPKNWAIYRSGTKILVFLVSEPLKFPRNPSKTPSFCRSTKSLFFPLGPGLVGTMDWMAIFWGGIEGGTTVDGSEILHQLRLVVCPIIYKVFAPSLVVQDFWTINRRYKREKQHVWDRERNYHMQYS